MAAQLVMAVVVVTPDKGILDGSIHAFDLTVGLGMVGLRQVGELDTVIGEDCVDSVGHRPHQRFEKGGSGPRVGTLDKLDEGEFRRPVNGDEEIELALRRAQLGDVDVEEPDGVTLEPSPGGFVALDLGQSGDTFAIVARTKGATWLSAEGSDGRKTG